MRKLFFLVLIVALFTACSQNVLDNSVGTVRFDASLSRGITASIEYPSLLNKVWNLTAEKLDNGGTSTETVNIRVVNGMVTHFSIGEHEGNLTINVSFDVLGAIV